MRRATIIPPDNRAARRTSAVPQRLLSVEQTCEALNIGRTQFYKLVSEKRLSIVKLGRRTLVKTEALDAFIALLGGAVSDDCDP